MSKPAEIIQYGMPISLGAAKQVMQAAEEKAAANNWAVSIAIVDSGGRLITFHRMDHAGLGSIHIAQGKAETAVSFKRETKSLEELIAAGGNNLRLLAAGNITPMEGGVPIFQNGRVIGAIGVSGAASSEDAEIAKAGANAV